MDKTRTHLLLPAVVYLLWSCSALAGPPELITDRPDQTESAAVVSPGLLQIEVGWTTIHDDENGVEVEVDEVPGTLLRIGLVERVELRVGWTGIVSEKVAVGSLQTDRDGAGDAELGAKVRLRGENGAIPEVALLVGASLPVGNRDFTSDRVDPSVRASLAHTLTERLSLGYNLGFELGTVPDTGGEKDTLASFIYTAALGASIGERLGAFVELFGDVPTSAGGGPTHSLDGGLTYGVRNNLQLDLAGGIGLNDRADDWFVGLGLSVRLPR